MIELKEKLAALEAQLLQDTPVIATILRDIHSKLKNDPDTVTLLTEEECAVLVAGLKKQTQTEIVTSVASSKPKKALSKMTLADL